MQKSGYDALDALDPRAFAEARARASAVPPQGHHPPEGKKHPDLTAHRAEQLARALRAAPEGTTDRAHRVLTHLEWNPLVDARAEYVETIADLLGPCSEVLLDFEGRQITGEGGD